MVESGDARTVLDNPQHPYSIMLKAAVLSPMVLRPKETCTAKTQRTQRFKWDLRNAICMGMSMVSIWRHFSRIMLSFASFASFAVKILGRRVWITSMWIFTVIA